MNEELKIIIKAVTDEAKKNLAAVKKELQNIEKEGEEGGKSIDAAMKSVAKGVAVAMASVAALTTALVALGKKSAEVQKQFAKLNAGFQAAGSTATQAGKTYQALFRFLGDSDRATEAAQSLARITTNTKDLSEWATILQGVYARAGNAIPVESLAEAANETMQVGTVTGALADALNWVGVSEDAFNEQLAQTTSLAEREALIRGTLNSLYGNAAGIYERNNQALIKYNESQASLDVALARASQYLLPLMTSLNQLSATFLTVFAPAIETVVVYLTAFIQLIAEAINWVGSFFGMFSSSTEKATADVEGYNQAMNNYMNSLKGSFGGANNEINKTSKNIDKVKKQLMGFDELNVVSEPTSAGATGGSGGAAGGAAMPSMPNMADYGLGSGSGMLDGLQEDLEEAKEKIKVIATIAAIAVGAFALWKLASFISDLTTAIQIMKQAEILSNTIFGTKMVEKAETFLGKLQNIASIFLVVAGAIVAVLGYSDAWVNGLDWGNFAAVLGGIAAVVAGVTLKFGAFGGGIAAVTGGVAMLVLGIKDLIENGASLENILTIVAGAIAVVTGAMMMMGKENIKAVAQWVAHTAALVAHKIATVASTVAQTALNLAMSVSPLGWIVIAITAVVAAFVLLWNNCEGFRNFWINLWESVKKAFSAAWDGIKNIFNGVGDFFSNILNKIKNVFKNIGSSIGSAISDTVKAAINGVLSMAVKRINGFIKAINIAISIINAIPGVDIKKLNELEVPKLARGGIINSATVAMIGEAGKEAVLPLENNTAWMDALADRIAARNNTPSKIVLQVDKKELGHAAIGSINDITRQTGKLQLVY